MARSVSTIRSEIERLDDKVTRDLNYNELGRVMEQIKRQLDNIDEWYSERGHQILWTYNNQIRRSRSSSQGASVFNTCIERAKEVQRDYDKLRNEAWGVIERIQNLSVTAEGVEEVRNAYEQQTG